MVRGHSLQPPPSSPRRRGGRGVGRQGGAGRSKASQPQRERGGKEGVGRTSPWMRASCFVWKSRCTARTWLRNAVSARSAATRASRPGVWLLDASSTKGSVKMYVSAPCQPNSRQAGSNGRQQVIRLLALDLHPAPCSALPCAGERGLTSDAAEGWIVESGPVLVGVGRRDEQRVGRRVHLAHEGGDASRSRRRHFPRDQRVLQQSVAFQVFHDLVPPDTLVGAALQPSRGHLLLSLSVECPVGMGCVCVP